LNQQRSLTTEKRLNKLIEKYEAQRKYCWDRDGDYSEELNDMTDTKRNAEIKKLFRMAANLDKELHYIYYEGSDQQYEDRYGNTLMIVSLEDLKKAIIKDQAQMVIEGYDNGYRRFNIALKMIESFQDKKDWNDNVKVVMWGH